MPQHSAEVDAWFDSLEHPLKPVMQRVREVLLSAAHADELTRIAEAWIVYKGA